MKAALEVYYSTDNNSIEAGRCLAASLPRHGIWRGSDAPWTMARQSLAYGMAELEGYGAVFEIISPDYVHFRNFERMIQTDVIT